MPATTSPLLLDRVSVWRIGALAFALVAGFALLYLALDRFAPGNGVAQYDGDPPMAWYDYFYFSLVTQATVGYGDIRPVGWARLAASAQAVVGIAVSGLLVAKLTTASISRYRILQKQACGDWVDIVRHRDGRIEVGFLKIEWREGALELSGHNYSPHGILVDSFHAYLLEDDWPRSLTFRYTSHEGAADFAEGFVTIWFHADGTGMPGSFSATVRDHVKPDTKPVIRGWRVLHAEHPHIAELATPTKVAGVVDYFLKKYLPHVPEVPAKHDSGK